MEQEFQFFVDDSIEENEPSDLSDERTLKVRLDKWLWAARFFKTRAVARAAVEKGRVFYNGERSKPSREIELGAILKIRHGRFEKTIIIKGLSTRRRSTDEALELFEETEESKLARELNQDFDRQDNMPFDSPVEFRREQPKEKRVVRFLRRSFPRAEQRQECIPDIKRQNAEFDDLNKC